MTKDNPLGLAPFDAAQYLDDEEGIAEFLNASIEMNDPTVLLNAVTTVARARSMSQLAQDSGLGRESLYKALKPGAQPRYDTVMKVLGALGVEMVFRAPTKLAPAAPSSTGRAKRVEVPEAKPKRQTAASGRRGAAVRAIAMVGKAPTPKRSGARRSVT